MKIQKKFPLLYFKLEFRYFENEQNCFPFCNRNRLDDLKETAIAISEEFENGLDIKHQTIFENLSKSYFLFKKEVY